MLQKWVGKGGEANCENRNHEEKEQAEEGRSSQDTRAQMWGGIRKGGKANRGGIPTVNRTGALGRPGFKRQVRNEGEKRKLEKRGIHTKTSSKDDSGGKGHVGGAPDKKGRGTGEIWGEETGGRKVTEKRQCLMAVLKQGGWVLFHKLWKRKNGKQVGFNRKNNQ